MWPRLHDTWFLTVLDISVKAVAIIWQVTPVDFAGTKELVVIDHRKSEAGEDLLGFEYRKQRFCYDSQAGAFTRLKYPAEVCQMCVRVCARHDRPGLPGLAWS